MSANPNFVFEMVVLFVLFIAMKYLVYSGISFEGIIIFTVFFSAFNALMYYGRLKRITRKR